MIKIITVEQIQYFLAIKKFNGFSNAANELCISQSSLSKQIKALEGELDTVLFDRSSRQTKLTPAGEDFYIYSKNFLANYELMIRDMKKHSSTKNTVLRLGTIAVLTQYKLNSVIAAFKNKYPSIDIKIFEGENDAILHMLEKSEIDFAIIRDFNLSNDNFNITTLANDELVVVTSNNHPFNNKKYISFNDLKNEKLIICTKSGVYDICEKECSKLGFKPKVMHDINKIETILGLVSEGLGITLIVNNVLTPFTNSNIKVHHLKNPISANLVLVSNKNTSTNKEISLFNEFISKEI